MGNPQARNRVLEWNGGAWVNKISDVYINAYLGDTGPLVGLARNTEQILFFY